MRIPFDSFTLAGVVAEAAPYVGGKVQRIVQPDHEVTIGVVGKYIEHRDAYKSIYESLAHAGMKISTSCGFPSWSIFSRNIAFELFAFAYSVSPS